MRDHRILGGGRKERLVPHHFSIRPGHAARLSDLAAERGVPVSAVLRDVLDRWIAEETPERTPTTGSELVAALTATGGIGLWADRTDIEDSSAFARKLRTDAESRSDRGATLATPE